MSKNEDAMLGSAACRVSSPTAPYPSVLVPSSFLIRGEKEEV
jgi:hypothetical protein